MELLSPAFLSALGAIVIIDLVLAGDNAIVIALAARNLPGPLRHRAIVWGTVGAVLVRTAMTLAVVWLLQIPGLLFAGGALLVWIAYRLLCDNRQDEHPLQPAKSFWHAMKTIVIADALMGLDNVLAVAGAAHGDFILVVAGLLISVPIMVFGSQLILKLVERFPVIVYLGAGVLAWTAVKMMTSEPLVGEAFAAQPALQWMAYVAVVGGVLLAGYASRHAGIRPRILQDLADAELVSDPASAGTALHPRGAQMERILIPVDGSKDSLEAVRHVVRQYSGKPAIEVHLLHVRTPLSQHIARFLGAPARAAYHREAAREALAPARALLRDSRLPYAVHVEMGETARTIQRVAERLHVSQITVGTARKGALARLIDSSAIDRLIDQGRVPVQIIAGETVSPLERYGVPAGIGAAAVALAYLAAD